MIRIGENPVAIAAHAAQQAVEASFADGQLSRNLRPLAKSLGVVALKRAPLQVAGMLTPSPDGYIVVVSSTLSPGDQRFVLAHEIGHLLLHNADDRIPLRHRASALRGSHDEVEQACNALADHMLMPEEQVVPIAHALGWSLEAVLQIASTCLVGIDHAANRLIALSPHHQSMIVWSRGDNDRPQPVRDPISKPGAIRVLGFRNDLSVIDIGSACRAFTQEGVFSGTVPMLVVRPESERPEEVMPYTQSVGSMSNERRIVHTLATISDEVVSAWFGQRPGSASADRPRPSGRSRSGGSSLRHSSKANPREGIGQRSKRPSLGMLQLRQ